MPVCARSYLYSGHFSATCTDELRRGASAETKARLIDSALSILRGKGKGLDKGKGDGKKKNQRTKSV